MDRKILVTLFIVFGVINLLLLAWSFLVFQKLMQFKEAIGQIPSELAVAYQAIFGALLELDYGDFLRSTVLIASISLTSFISSILMVKNNKLFRVVGLFSSGLFIAYIIYFGLYASPMYIAMGAFSSILILLLFMF